MLARQQDPRNRYTHLENGYSTKCALSMKRGLYTAMLKSHVLANIKVYILQRKEKGSFKETSITFHEDDSLSCTAQLGNTL
jgi:hypothetical protein